MATSSHQLTDDYTCAYCFQKLPRMADPRELPCTHIFCFPCLKDDFTDIGIFLWVHDRQTHDIENIQDLPKVNLPSCSVNSKDEQPCAALCDVCTESRELATVFCSDCSKSFCKEHAQMHTLLHEEEHEVTLVQSKLSQTQTCQEHPENILTQACRSCHSMFCSSCSTESECESSSEMDDMNHSIIDVNLFAEELRQKMRTESMDITNRIELVCCVEKSIPNNLTEAENKVSQLIRAVDMAANTRILDIQNKSASAKDKLKFFFEIS
ncbi:E3 ubiquitin-protein ligase TRIM33-like [Watersipora subatra]|uniref:E3 ubiquitin-protein ligase TRIM33-like n=1 Tax=Watersipora subatra TaxID=2589382 RepID=UPI00355C37D8